MTSRLGEIIIINFKEKKYERNYKLKLNKLLFVLRRIISDSELIFETEEEIIEVLIKYDLLDEVFLEGVEKG